MILEDFERGSFKFFLRSLLKKIDDQALKEVDYKKILGPFLLDAKYKLLEWTVTEDKDNDSFDLLISIISERAEETDILQIPNYQNPSKLTILNCLKKIEELRKILKEEDSILITVPGNEPIYIDQSSHINIEIIEELITNDKEMSHQIMELIVKKPDYIESSMWEFRHGKTLSAKIEDEKWLQSFQTMKSLYCLEIHYNAE